MPILYTDIDKKFWFRQPNLTRWRHKFRSPRESLKINQEIGQTHYDLHRVNLRSEAVSEEVDAMRENAFNGWDFDGDVDYDWSTDATPSASEAEFIGLNELVIRIEILRDRIRHLEA